MNAAPVLIKPKKSQQIEKTKSDIKNKVDPTKLSVKVNNVHERKNGSIAISCGSEESIKKDR